MKKKETKITGFAWGKYIVSRIYKIRDKFRESEEED